MEGVHGDSMHMEVRGPLCSWFPPSTFTWVPRSEWVLRFALVGGKCFYPLNCHPCFPFKETVSSTQVGFELAM